VSRLSGLAAKAMHLLGCECPVCGQAIDPEHVRTHTNLEQVITECSSQLPQRKQRLDTAAGELTNRATNERESARRRDCTGRAGSPSSARLAAWLRARVAVT
jgi:DNA repair exonuclease SbcCD ATPase subunit